MKNYQIIYADPPWDYDDKRQDKRKYGGKEYPTLTIKELCDLPIATLADDNCALFLWVTMPQLEVGFEVINSWGFKYKTCGFTWVKTYKGMGWYFGLGNWTRANSGLCLLSFKGKMKRLRNDIPQLVVSEIMEHSHKPAIVREYIVGLLGDLPRIELFARRKVEGWDCWGNEVESDIDLSVTPEVMKAWKL